MIQIMTESIYSRHEEGTGNTRVLIIHRFPLVYEGISRILRDGGYTVFQEAGCSRYRLNSLSFRPDIIILDDAQETETYTIMLIRELFPEAKLVVITGSREQENIVSAIRHGVRGYLTTDIAPKEFLETLKRIAEGWTIIFKNEDSGGKAIEASVPTPFIPLSKREKEVLQQIGTGATNKEIADVLFLSEHTVKVHLRTILNKLNLRNRQQAAAYAARAGFMNDLEKTERV